MEFPSIRTVESDIEHVDDEDNCVLSGAIKTAVHGLGKGVEKIRGGMQHFVDDMTNGVKNIVESFTVSLPLTQEGKPGSDDGNLGNNVHLPSLFPNGAPYRFGLHIRRDDSGYTIARIFEDTIAHHAKLQEDDILTHLNDIDLGSTNIVKVLTLFSRVGNPFSLTILREVESGVRAEIVIEINIDIDEVGRSIEIKVTARGSPYIQDRNYPMAPYYITQDPDGGSQQYVNITSNGKLIMGYDLDAFVFERYFTIDDSDGSIPSVLKTVDGNQAFDFNRQKLVSFDRWRLTYYVLNATAGNDGSYVFEQLNRQGNDDNRCFLNNTNGEIVVSSFENPESVPSSGRFSLYEVDDATTSTSQGMPGRGRRHDNIVY